jgi:hypothetical protein
VLTVTGVVQLKRRYLRCPAGCGGRFPLDERLGINGYVSGRAQRLLTLAAASWSYDQSAELLQEFCGLQVSDTTIRSTAQEHGEQMRRWQQQHPAACTAFAQARGEAEFATDGTSVNTTKGWREMRLGVFAKRRRGRPQSVVRWEERHLPAPTARVAFAGLVRAESFGGQWRAWASRLGLKQTNELTVLADGARWIWKQVDRHLPGAQGVLDIYHASAHLHQTAAVLHGEETKAAHRWVEERRRVLLQGGASALLNLLTQERKTLRSPRQRASLDDLSAYLRPHVDHTPYRQRLANGQTIGSGMVEGACKTVIGRRLKQTGARWRIRRVERMASLCCVLYSRQWDAYWSRAAA